MTESLVVVTEHLVMVTESLVVMTEYLVGMTRLEERPAPPATDTLSSSWLTAPILAQRISAR